MTKKTPIKSATNTNIKRKFIFYFSLSFIITLILYFFLVHYLNNLNSSDQIISAANTLPTITDTQITETTNTSQSFAYGPILNIENDVITFSPYDMDKEIPLHINADTIIKNFGLNTYQCSDNPVITISDVNPNSNIIAYYTIHHDQKIIYADSIEIMPITTFGGTLSIDNDQIMIDGLDDQMYTLNIDSNTVINKMDSALQTSPATADIIQPNLTAVVYSGQKPINNTVNVDRIDIITP